MLQEGAKGIPSTEADMFVSFSPLKVLRVLVPCKGVSFGCRENVVRAAHQQRSHGAMANSTAVRSALLPVTSILVLKRLSRVSDCYQRHAYPGFAEANSHYLVVLLFSRVVGKLR